MVNQSEKGVKSRMIMSFAVQLLIAKQDFGFESLESLCFGLSDLLKKLEERQL